MRLNISKLSFLLLSARLYHISISRSGGSQATDASTRKFKRVFFATLGLECNCCDGAKGECRSSWESSCPKLKCHPWKSH
ncbi:hypothetical protein OIU78_005478 [Salix suchowensis]|nr:hypothetical protein OIU78_005478 [Salix suchowensis]